MHRIVQQQLPKRKLPFLSFFHFFFIPESTHWASFSAAIFSSDLIEDAMIFWRNTGSGLSTRHGTFCLQEFDYMESDFSDPDFRAGAPQKRAPDRAEDAWMQSAITTMLELRSFIAHLATSTKPGQPPIHLGCLPLPHRNELHSHLLTNHLLTKRQIQPHPHSHRIRLALPRTRRPQHLENHLLQSR